MLHTLTLRFGTLTSTHHTSCSPLSPQCWLLLFVQVDLRPASEHAPELRRQHQRLAEISELIHVASLLHDDVIDDASTRRGIAALNINVGNKTAILAGVGAGRGCWVGRVGERHEDRG